ncbi:MAG: sulfotransferase domain-containing protein [Oceanicaulis sp.]|nr:sulfotransferase domain-containing protein [Oceanicaulis sp.]
MSATPENLVVLGFPKCGTTALMLELGARRGVEVLRSRTRKLEIQWPEIQSIEDTLFEPGVLDHKTVLVAHKCTSYIYDQAALTYLAQDENRKYLICLRDPVKSLRSWWKMHKDIATSGRNKAHFAWQDREFFAHCDIGQYYLKYAQSRLNYGFHISAALKIIPSENLYFMSQTHMAKDISAAVDGMLTTMFEPDVYRPILRQTDHVGFGDNTDLTVPGWIEAEIRANHDPLISELGRLGKIIGFG